MAIRTMADDPYSFEPLHKEDESSLPPPLPPRVGKAAQRVWMVAFWAAFILALLQFGIAAAMVGQRIEPGWEDEPLLIASVWLWRRGMIVDMFIAGAASLIAMYGFARARAGKSFRAPILIWLALRLTIVAVLLVSFLYLKAEGYQFPPWDMLPGRLLIIDSLVWIFLLGTGVYLIAKRELPEPARRRQPQEPFAPWP
jgi:hypothetical protein